MLSKRTLPSHLPIEERGILTQRKLFNIILALIIVLFILVGTFVPLRTELYPDGTTVREAIFWTEVDWHGDDGNYENTRRFWFVHKNIDNLFKLEMNIRLDEMAG